MMNYKNKTAIITGAASGIGKKIAETLYEKGCNVVLCDIQEELLRNSFSKYDAQRTLIQKTDVRKPEDWQSISGNAIGKFGAIDFLLNIAGVIEPGYIHETTIEKIDRQIDINLKGAIYGVHCIAPKMVERRQGHIINISSMAGIAPIPGLNIYSATKFGIRGFSLAVAQELHEHHVHVSVVCPDAVKTQMLDYQKDKKEAAMTFSAKKFLTVDDLNKAILSLLEKPKYEVWLPRSRGVLATIGSLFPRLTLKLKNKLIKKGLEKQKRY